MSARTKQAQHKVARLAKRAAQLLLDPDDRLCHRRIFDGLFEDGDGDAVYAALIRLAAANPPLIQAMRTRGFPEWADDAERFAAWLADE